MNKRNLTSIICFIFILQLMVPVSMIGYSRFIDWGLRERASVYNVELNTLEYYVNTNSVYLNYMSPIEGTHKGIYASITTGKDGFADFVEVTKKKPSGNYIRSRSDSYFVYPGELKWLELQVPIHYEGEGNWMYMIDARMRHQWGYGYSEAPVYFESAYAVIRVFKGYVRLDGVFVDGENVADYIQQQLDAGAYVE